MARDQDGIETKFENQPHAKAAGHRVSGDSRSPETVLVDRLSRIGSFPLF